MKLSEIETRCNIDYQVNSYKFSNVMVEMHDSIHSKIHYYVLYLVNEINDRNGIK